MELNDLLKKALDAGGSDIYIVPGACPMVKIAGGIAPILDTKLSPEETANLLNQVYALDAQRDMARLMDAGDDDFSFSVRGLGRFRCNAYKQRGSLAAVLRSVPFHLPDPQKLGIPEAVIKLGLHQKGLVLVTGPAGSGKSTTLACIIDRINHESRKHIITIEDPIEFLHPHINSIVSQREIEHDTLNYASALRAALRQAPDVILLGEMRDYETIQTALTAAETGHLVLSTLHTMSAAKTIDRIIDVFPSNRQQQVRVQLSMVLEAVVSQQLLPTVDGRLTPAFEIMIANPAIRNMVRDGKVHQMDNVIYGGASQGMLSMDAEIMRLLKSGIITRDTAALHANNPEFLQRNNL